MLARILSGTVIGVDGLGVQVEVDMGFGLPSFSIVGLADGAVRESRDRVRAAIKNSGYEFPNRKITVNLAPADVKKEGTGFDLPIALGVLAAAETLRSELLQQFAVTGELSLDGTVRPSRGVLPMALNARTARLRGILVPMANAREAAVVTDIEVIGVASLHEAVEFLAGLLTIVPTRTDPVRFFAREHAHLVDFSEVRGQEHVKRALEIAAAGGHNILMHGPPGSGKTMLARRLPTILPDLSFDDALETTKIYSVMGLLPEDTPLITGRPFRAPHHTISDAGLIGGGQVPRPGEVSLAHNGVLFLDESPEFRKHVLEVLRQPLEDGVVTIARAAQSLTFPARFLLVAAMNPCPCGFFGDTSRDCTCTPSQVKRYATRLSGPLLDRIDMHLEVPAVPFRDLQGTTPEETSAAIKRRVNRARKVQAKRFTRRRHVACNARMASGDVEKFCVLDPASRGLLRDAVDRLGLSARAYTRVLKLARTIADLGGEVDIEAAHVAEAVQFRRMDIRWQ